MKLLFENWRKFLVEQPTIRGLHDTDWTIITEDDLYNYSYDDLIATRDEINRELAEMQAIAGGNLPLSAHAGYNLLSTINARIEAIEESEAEEAAHVEDIYSGEYAMKLAKAVIGSSKMGIDLALMVPDTESLVEEFRRIRKFAQEIHHRADDGDSAPWRDWDWRRDERPQAADDLLRSMDALIKQLAYIPGEITWEGSDLIDDAKEIYSMLDRWRSAMEDLEIYAHYKLHGGTFAPSYLGGTTKYIDSYHFIKDWVGEE